MNANPTPGSLIADAIDRLREQLFDLHQQEGGCDSEFEAYVRNAHHPEAVALRAIGSLMRAAKDELDDAIERIAALTTERDELKGALRHIDDYCTRQCNAGTEEAALWAQCAGFARYAITTIHPGA
jgi:hypothetical protein